MTTHTLDAPGAVLSYEVLGSGPVLALIGHPMPADGFRPLAERLTGAHTVVLHDPRGTGASTMTDSAQPPDVATLADDLSRVLAAVTSEPADVFGSSGGAITALELAATHPEQMRTVVAHEPPLVEYLADADLHRANGDEVQRLHREQGLLAAMGEFARQNGFPPPPELPGEADQRAMTRMVLGLRSITSHRVGDLPEGRVAVGVGAWSGQATTGRTAAAVAAEHGLPLLTFPGGHGGFHPGQGGDPVAFAAALEEALSRGR
ncbi:alpha/beta fold hydrolase [Klenkia brasiliensis]|uniref:Pimeloyl-ACP methyl ester carboxylesterase n=1 Tax=Klenkia brasiliensis TaxID=333142 RepID=A0A1G8A2R7_9ACTN|nr:alpha/beta hydrolase [Klenkia brasiliensis]SDH15224.1 Pimeloyl-ACP methyl ester carboxylesterase [Klenkia brasiliensis]